MTNGPRDTASPSCDYRNHRMVQQMMDQQIGEYGALGSPSNKSSYNMWGSQWEQTTTCC